MPGQIIQRGERTWLVRVSMGRDPLTQKRKTYNETVHGTKKDAQQVLTKLLREQDTGTFIEPSAVSLDAYLDRWLETSAKPRVRASTFESYEILLKVHVRPKLGQKRLNKITPMDVQSVYAHMQERGLSARTVRYTHAVLSSALGQAVKWRMLATNPAQYADLPTNTKKPMRSMTADEVQRFLATAERGPWGVLFAFALATGMRPSEYLGLQWRDVDLVAGSVVVRHALTRKKGGRALTAPKTSRSRRTIPLPASTVRSLREHKARQAEERLGAGPAYQAQDFVFAGPTGSPLGERSVVARFKNVLKEAELPLTFRLYDLRHTTATMLLQANEHPKIVSERLGHSSITLTMDTYSHVLPTMQRGAADKLESILFGS